MSKNIKLARYRNSDYIVRCEIDGNKKVYQWKGSKGKKFDQKSVPEAVIDWLNMNTQALSNGELVILEDNEDTKRLKDDIVEKERYEQNTHTREDIEKVLKGNFPKMKKKLNEITVDGEKQFILDVAEELKDDLPNGKTKFIAEWAGVEHDILFD